MHVVRSWLLRDCLGHVRLQPDLEHPGPGSDSSLTGFLEARRLAPANVGREVTALRRMLKRTQVEAGIADTLGRLQRELETLTSLIP